MTFKINSEQSGHSVLSFLKSKLKISSSALASLKRIENGICVNGSHITVRYILKENDLLEIRENDSFDDQNESIEPHEMSLDIIFENDDLFIINKPPYMPTHPSHGHTDDTLANALAYIYKQRNEPLVFRPIGRLDRNTSGLSLIAKNSISASYLHYARTHGMFKKKYLALLKGEVILDGRWHTIDTYMKRMDDSVIVRCIGDEGEEGSFKAITHWRLLYSSKKVSLVEAIPETGRTHQLRVHFAHISHPIIGDDIYGAESSLIHRHALHAYSLSIPIPYTDEIREFISPPPDDIKSAFKALTMSDMTDILKNLNRSLDET